MKTTLGSVLHPRTAGFDLYIEPFVPRYVAKAASRCLALLRDHVRLAHRIEVLVMPSAAVTVAGFLDGTEECGFGLFFCAPPIRKQPRPRILLAGLMPRVLERDHNLSRAESIEAFTETICHEVIHYEQFRDGRRCHHRGIESRTKSLARKVLDA